jgi:hypothetical protein
MPADEPLMRACTGLIMLRADGWQESYGMGEEFKAFTQAGRPVVWMDPGILPYTLLKNLA